MIGAAPAISNPKSAFQNPKFPCPQYNPPGMELTSDLLNSAREGDRAAVVELLASYYPVVWRMSSGLTGRADVGRNVTRFLLQRSLRALPAWKDEAAPTRWFHHHTLLTTRRAGPPPGDNTSDTLLANGTHPPSYIAYVNAVRALPMQQREAYILANGESLDIRAIAIAMDCSVLAAGNHLHEANDKLRTLDSANLDAHAMRLGKVYRSLAPREELALTDIRKRVKKHYFPRLIWRITRAILAAVLFVGGAWGAYIACRVVWHSMDH